MNSKPTYHGQGFMSLQSSNVKLTITCINFEENFVNVHLFYCNFTFIHCFPFAEKDDRLQNKYVVKNETKTEAVMQTITASLEE